MPLVNVQSGHVWQMWSDQNTEHSGKQTQEYSAGLHRKRRHDGRCPTVWGKSPGLKKVIVGLL